MVVSFAGMKMTGVRIDQLVRFAYHWPYDIEWPVGWFDKRGGLMFDVEGVSGSVASKDQVRLMTRALLAERFRFSSHVERKRRLVYRMTPGEEPKWVLSKAEVSEGIQLVASHFDPQRPGGDWDWVATGVDPEEFAIWLSPVLDLPVLDGTGTARRFDFSFSLFIGPDQGMARASKEKLRSPELWINAFERQIGIRLTKEEADFPTLHVDTLEKLIAK